MGRTSDARERILAAGAELFGQRSYASIGVAQICAAAGVPKGSFYYFFESKQALALAVIDEHWTEQRGQRTALLVNAEPPLQRLRALFEATETVQRTGQRDTGSV